jgi:tetratricopeptide (TPR) repeat protein
MHSDLRSLQAAEFLYETYAPTAPVYTFKHVLTQEVAYQSLVRRTRQQYHKCIAQVLAAQFPEVAETQPELLAQHYTEASFPEQALRYWQHAGQRAVERSANIEALSHFTKGLELLKTLPETPERAQQELTLQLSLGPLLKMLKGHTAPETEGVYTRAYELSQQLGDNRQQFLVLIGLGRLYISGARLRQAYELGEQCLTLAQHVQDPVVLLETHEVFGTTSFYLGNFVMARRHLERGLALYDVQPDHSRTFSSAIAIDPGVVCLSLLAWTLWLLGYPDQALTRSDEALALAQQLSHAYSLNFALTLATVISAARREMQCVREQAEATIALACEQGFVRWLAVGTAWRGWALVEQGEAQEGIRQMCQAVTMWRAMEGNLELPQILMVKLAESYGKAGQTEEGMCVLAEALAEVHKSEERRFEAELYRCQGELLLRSGLRDLHSAIRNPQLADAETCFRQAIDVARAQHAKSLELRAVMSLGRLWQAQGKCEEARQLLQETYHWFTEGFDTPDLQEAQALLAALQ